MEGLRIIAGELKGRRIKIPRGFEVRPTPERVREALFSILYDRIVEARVLDAYAGSGALGFEALSRGAASSVFIEAAPAGVRALRENAEALGLSSRSRILRGRALQILPESGTGRFDLIFADPPYSGEEAGLFLRHLAGGEALAEGGLIVLERPSRAEPLQADGLALIRSERYGSTRIDFYRQGIGAGSSSSSG